MSGAAATLPVEITAKDRITAVLDRLQGRLDAVEKRANALAAPFRRVADQAKRFADMSGLTKVGRQVGELGHRARQAAGAVSQLVAPLGAIASAASIAGMVRLTTAWADWGSRLGWAAQRMGVLPEQLGALQGAARLAGASAGSLTSGLTTLGTNMSDAVGGRAPAVVAMFSTLGVRFRDAGGHARGVAEVLPELADKIAGIRDPFVQARVATSLFGGAAEELLPFLRKGSAGIREYEEAARRYGVTNQAGVDGANRLREAQARLGLAVQGLGNIVAEKLAPVLEPLLLQLADWIARNREWIATGFGEAVRRLGEWIKAIDWGAVSKSLGEWGDKAKWVTDLLGGPQHAVELFLGVMAARWALGAIAPFTSLGLAIGKVVFSIGTTLVTEAIPAAIAAFGRLRAAKLAAEVGAEAAGGIGANMTLAARLGELGLMGAGIVGAGVGTMALSTWGAYQHAEATSGGNLWWDRLLGRPTTGNTWRDPLTGEVMGSDDAPSVASRPRRSWSQMRVAGREMGQAPIAATDLPPEARGLLRTIASGESHGYGDLYGGGQTTDFSRHPNVAAPITSGPNAGQTSTAAGRYQFLKSTWDAEAAKLGLRDFSPASQDRAAWDDAQSVYRRKTGHDLLEDLRSPNPRVRAGVGTALHSEWTSLPGGIEQGQNGSQFLDALNRNTAAQLAAPAAAPAVAALPQAEGAPQQVPPAPGLGAAELQNAIQQATMQGNMRLHVAFSGTPPAGIRMQATSASDNLSVSGVAQNQVTAALP